MNNRSHAASACIGLIAVSLGAASLAQDSQDDAARQAEIRRMRDAQNAIPDTPGTGPFRAIKETDPTLADHVIYRPADLDELGGVKLGVYVFGNGGCTDDGASSRLHLLEIASHGYLAIAPGRIYNGPGAEERPAPTAGAAEPPSLPPPATRPGQLAEAIDWALAENERQGSRYFGRIDPDAVALSGYSCGGLQALVNADDARVATLVIMNSGVFNDGVTRMSGMEVTKHVLDAVHSPTIYILGGPTDIAYANGMDDFARIDRVPISVANIDKGHGGTYWEPNGGAAAQVAVEWLDWRLRGDESAAAQFAGEACGLCEDPAWTYEAKSPL